MAGSAGEWEQICSDSFVPLRVGWIGEGFRARIAQAAVTADVRVSEVRCGASQVLRTGHLARNAAAADYLFVVHMGGAGTVEQDGRTADLRVRGGVLYDTSRPYTLAFPGPGLHEVVLQVPRAMVGHGDRQSRDSCGRAFGGEVPALRALGAMMTELVAAYGGGAEVQGGADPAIAWAMAELLASILSSAGVGGHRQGLDRTASLELVRQHVRDHLGDPDLSPPVLAARFGFSLRYLHALFHGTGATAAAFIRDERLELAHRLLGRPSCRYLTVVAVARRCGFTDVTTFARAFRRRFGCTPSESRGLAASNRA